MDIQREEFGAEIPHSKILPAIWGKSTILKQVEDKFKVY